MTVSTTLPTVTYAPTQSTTTFAFTFPVLNVDNIRVYRIINGVTTLLEIGTNYSAFLDADTAGSVVLNTDISTGLLTIRRALPYQQDTEWVNGSSFDQGTLEANLDYLTMLVQQVLVEVQSPL